MQIRSQEHLSLFPPPPHPLKRKEGEGTLGTNLPNRLPCSGSISRGRSHLLVTSQIHLPPLSLVLFLAEVFLLGNEVKKELRDLHFGAWLIS